MMNLAQSGILPPPSPWFVPYPHEYRRPESPPAGSHQEKVLQFLYRHRSRMAFGTAQRGFSFIEMATKVGKRNTTGSSLIRLRRKGYITCEKQGGKVRYRITELGICAL